MKHYFKEDLPSRKWWHFLSIRSRKHEAWAQLSWKWKRLQCIGWLHHSLACTEQGPKRIELVYWLKINWLYKWKASKWIHSAQLFTDLFRKIQNSKNKMGTEPSLQILLKECQNNRGYTLWLFVKYCILLMAKTH
mgnify:CR=1 FL=1